MISSTKWKMWKAIVDLRTCLPCRQNNGKIYDVNEIAYPSPPLHLNCRCTIERLKAMFAGSATKKEFEGADWYLKVHGKLPDYYITYEQAKKEGWEPEKGDLFLKCPEGHISKQERTFAAEDGQNYLPVLSIAFLIDEDDAAIG